MLYQIQATVVEKRADGYSVTHQIPTFYLDSNIQGIVSEEHAAKIATDILNPAKLASLQVHVAATKEEDHPHYVCDECGKTASFADDAAAKATGWIYFEQEDVWTCGEDCADCLDACGYGAPPVENDDENRG